MVFNLVPRKSETRKFGDLLVGDSFWWANTEFEKVKECSSTHVNTYNVNSGFYTRFDDNRIVNVNPYFYRLDEIEKGNIFSYNNQVYCIKTYLDGGYYLCKNLKTEKTEELSGECLVTPLIVE